MWDLLGLKSLALFLGYSLANRLVVHTIGRVAAR